MWPLFSDLRVKLGLALALALATGLGVVRAYERGVSAGRAEVQARWDHQRADDLRATTLALAHEASVTAHRITAQQEIVHEARTQADSARRDAAAAERARDGLRQQLAAFLAAHPRPADPAAAGSGPPAGDPLGVLADVLDRADARAGELAQVADQFRIAGLACERAYDALTEDL